MLQRIQTIFFLISAGLLSLLFFIPFGKIAVGDGAETIFQYDTICNHVFPIVFTSGIIILLIVDVFMYKNRSAQQRLTIFIIILEVILFVVLLAMIAGSTAGYDFNRLTDNTYIGTIFPGLAAFLTYFGLIGVRKDEKLVRSTDRLR